MQNFQTCLKLKDLHLENNTKLVSVTWHSVFINIHKLGAVKNSQEIIVCSLPHGVTVDDFRDYFEQFGAVELIDLMCKALAGPHTTEKTTGLFILTIFVVTIYHFTRFFAQLLGL